MTKVSALEVKIDLLIAYATAETPEAKAHYLKRLKQIAHPVEELDSRECGVKTEVEDALMELGVSCNLAGFNYVADAVTAVVKDPHYKNCITKCLYPDIAKLHDTTPVRVERCVRTAVAKVFDRCDVEVLSEYFGSAYSPDKGCMTNSEFIFGLAHVIRRKIGGTNAVD
jgi:two-component system response regulator (stage 0 sporulation protein A)